MSHKDQDNLEGLNYMGIIVFCFFLTFAFMAGELFAAAGYFYWMLVTVLLLGANLVLVNYKLGRVVSFWITIGWITLVVIVGMSYANKHQLVVCYAPLIIEGVILGIALVLVYFRVPERWC